MKYKRILAIDPSGSYAEGKGTTGWVLMNDDEYLATTGTIAATDYSCAEEYWNAHLQLIDFNYQKHGDDMIVVIEDYRLYRDRALNQSNSLMETCRLLGLIQWYCWRNQIPITTQLAADVKTRWSDELLIREHILYKDGNYFYHTDSGFNLTTPHIRDAFRHATHYTVCRNQAENKFRGRNTTISPKGYWIQGGKHEFSNYKK